MFRKLMKNNLKFGRNTFLGMAALMVLASIFLKIIASNVFNNIEITGLITLVMIPVAVVCVVLIFQHYNRSLFGNEGYFTLTIPTRRKNVLISQILTALIWFVFMLIMAAISLVILTGTSTLKDILSLLSNFNNVVTFAYMLLNVLIYAIYMIIAVFMGITISNVSMMGRRIQGGVAAIITFAYMSICSLFQTLLEKVFAGSLPYFFFTGERFLFTLNHEEIVRGGSTIVFSGELTAFICTIVFTIGAYFITRYLLEKRVDIK
jgi:hypothetical protein